MVIHIENYSGNLVYIASDYKKALHWVTQKPELIPHWDIEIWTVDKTEWMNAELAGESHE